MNAIKKETFAPAVKKHRNKNEYYYAGNNLWVRNFTKKSVSAIDINNLIPEVDMPIMLGNETINHSKMIQHIETESITHEKIVIVSDGYKFNEKQKLLEQLPNDVIVIGVHETLNKWANNKKMNYYVVNNPYPECVQLLSGQQRVFPILVTSMRTCPEFIEKFKNLIYGYSPTTDCFYSGQKSESDYFIDDYRNPICAAIAIAYRFSVKRLMLFCCDNVFNEQRPAMEKLPNGLWIYPQQQIAHNLIDGNLYWLKLSGVKTSYHSQGPDYKNAEYIGEDKLSGFFR
jgi:hypothetical protein